MTKKKVQPSHLSSLDRAFWREIMEHIPSVDTLLEQDPNSVYHWIRQIQTGRRSAPEDFHWLGLVEAATSQATFRHNLIDQQDLMWALVALAAYQILIDHTGQHDSWELSMMHLRALLIRRYRSLPRNVLLDIDQIVNWFWARLPISFDEAQQKVNQLKTLPADDLLDLRRIKNRLAVLIPLVDDHKLQPDTQLQRWLGLREHLP